MAPNNGAILIYKALISQIKNNMKMDKIKLIETAIKGLDWKAIMEFYNSKTFVESDGRKTSRHIESVRKELKDLVHFVIESHMEEVQHDQWIIFWRNERLDIAFVPTRSSSHSKEEPPIEVEEMDMDDMEKEALEELLEKNTKEENYELCAVIRDRLKQIVRAKNKGRRDI
jgi:hypothetical protein